MSDHKSRLSGLTEALFSTLHIGELTLSNRLSVAPMTRVTATEEGVPTPSMRDYYLRFARGGFGLITTEGLYTDQAFSQGYRHQPGLADDEQARAWARINEDLHAHGTRVFAQLMHAGALSQGNRFRGYTVAPSAVQPLGQQMAFYYGNGVYPTPVPMTESDIDEAVQGFVDAAARAVNIGGFDGIEIHGANGYLLDQFLTAHTNLRTDRWGGGVAQRVALLVRVVEAVKQEVGHRVPVGIRISQGKVNDFTHKWPGREADAQEIFAALASAGVDFLHVTEFEAWKPAFEGGRDSLVGLARRFAPNVVIIANGSLHDRERANEVLTAGADVIAMGRGALSNPDLPGLFAAGSAPRVFDSSILGPIANIKPSELAFGVTD